jgi:hypothetical protein
LKGEQISTRPSAEHFMDNSTAAPPLQGDLLLLNQLELVSPTTVAGTLYGISFTLFCLYVYSLLPRLRDAERKLQARFMLGYTIVIMLCGLVTLVSSTWVTQDGYIRHSDYPGGPYLYTETTFRTPVQIALSACELAVNIFTSAIQVRVFLFFSKPSYKLTEFRARFGAFGSYGKLLDMLVLSL